MSSVKTSQVVHARFEAARQLVGQAKGLRQLHRHGHGFQITAIAQSEGAFDALAEGLNRACAPLNYQDLNDHFGDAVDNRALLEHFERTLEGFGIKQLRLETQPGTVSTLDLSESRAFRVSKTYAFEAAHQLPNVPEGHKCGRMHGHGFSVTIETKAHDHTSTSAFIESQEGLIDAAWAPLGQQLNWACLNDLPGLENPTSEHLAVWLWERLQSLEGLVTVAVYETPTAGCVFDGQTMRIWKQQSFDSAVKLAHVSDHDPRRLIHGHTFNVRLHLQGPLDEVLGWVYDYGDVKRAFGPLFDSLDHRPLYAIKGLEHADDLTLAQYIYQHMKPVLPKLSGVDVEHRPNVGAWLVEADV